MEFLEEVPIALAVTVWSGNSLFVGKPDVFGLKAIQNPQGESMAVR